MIWKAIKIILSEFIVTVGWALTIVGALLLISLKLSSKNDIIEVVVDNFDGKKYYGRSYMDAPEIDSAIIFTSKEKLCIGDFVNVRITDFDGYDLIGELV